jgi:hypothetical protein
MQCKKNFLCFREKNPSLLSWLI